MSGRIRTIKPEILEDELAVGLSDRAWRLWVSSWVLADDHGNLRAHERYLAANVWQNTSVDVAPALAELLQIGRFEPYAVDGQRYVHIKNFDRHQRVDNAGKPRVPTPDLDDGTWNQMLGVRFAETRRGLPEAAESVGGSPLRARAPSPTTTNDQRPTTDRPAASAASARTELFEVPEQENQTAAKPGAASRKTRGSNTAARGSRMTPDWTPSAAVLAWAETQGIADPLGPLEEFRDFWLGVPGQKGVKLTWDGTYRNRLRELVKQGRIVPRRRPRYASLPTPEAPSPDDAAAQAQLDATLAELEAHAAPFMARDPERSS